MPQGDIDSVLAVVTGITYNTSAVDRVPVGNRVITASLTDGSPRAVAAGAAVVQFNRSIEIVHVNQAPVLSIQTV